MMGPYIFALGCVIIPVIGLGLVLVLGGDGKPKRKGVGDERKS